MAMSERELHKRERWIKFVTYLIVKLKSSEPLKPTRDERNYLASLIGVLKSGEPWLGELNRDTRNELMVHLMFEQTRAVSAVLDAHPETFMRIGGGHYALRADPSKTSRDE